MHFKGSGNRIPWNVLCRVMHSTGAQMWCSTLASLSRCYVPPFLGYPVHKRISVLQTMMFPWRQDRKTEKQRDMGRGRTPSPWDLAAFPAGRKEISALLIRPTLPTEIMQGFPTDTSNVNAKNNSVCQGQNVYSLEFFHGSRPLSSINLNNPPPETTFQFHLQKEILGDK